MLSENAPHRNEHGLQQPFSLSPAQPAPSQPALAVPKGPLCAPEFSNRHPLESEVEQLTGALASRFEELSLIHGLTQRLTNSLTLAEQPSHVATSLLEELAPCIATQSLGIQLLPDDGAADYASDFPMRSYPVDTDEIFASVGRPISWPELLQIGEAAKSRARQGTGDQPGIAIVNDLSLGDGKVIRVAVVPIRRRDVCLGQMIAIRDFDQPEFGTIQADMMLSTSTMLAVHLINQRQFLQMQNMFEGMIHSLASALDAKDAYTCGHSSRVAELSFQLASRLQYSKDQLTNIRMAGILHDIGKIGVDDSVLQKPGRLTEEEFEKIKLHPVLGYEILKGIDQFRGILPAVRHHHESWNGTGYPDRLMGDSIPRDAQIMAVADAFDAMTSDRPYRSGMPLEKVIQIFEEGRGTQWAADVVDVLLSGTEMMKQHADRTRTVTSLR